MEYRLGVIGIGHWFRRLYAGISSVGGIEISKALGTRPYESKAEMLEGFGIGKERYYTIGKEGSIPPQFFDGIDAVHISDPNSFHARQIKETLAMGKKAIVEKTFAINKKEFDGLIAFIKNGHHEDSVYIHLHYLHKLPTIEMKSDIEGVISKHGKIVSASATFFEEANDEDAKRGWLFEMSNGGLFMDWVHPFEAIYYLTGAAFGEIADLSLYMTNESYSNSDPTGIRAEVGLKGKCFADGAKLFVNVAKGVENRYARKSIMIRFESDAYARLDYIGSEKESRGKRGGIEVGRFVDGKAVPSVIKPLSGESSSEIFVKEIFELCGGLNKGLTIEEIERIFKPQWEYQSISKGRELIKDRIEVNKFLEERDRERSGVMMIDGKPTIASIVFEWALVVICIIGYAALVHYSSSYVMGLAVLSTLIWGLLGLAILILIALSYGIYTKNFDAAHEFTNVIRLFGYPIIAIILLNVIGINITSLLVGAGFLGIIVGLAAQTTLGNMFAGFSILYSKPFRVGERIAVSTPQYSVQSPSYPHNMLEVEVSGTVKAIGMMHTRLLRDDMTLIYIPNSIMNLGLITNYSRASERMIVLRGEIERKTDVGHVKKRIERAFRGREFRRVRDLKITLANLSTPGDVGIKVTGMVLQTEYEKTRELMAEKFISTLRETERKRRN